MTLFHRAAWFLTVTLSVNLAAAQTATPPSNGASAPAAPSAATAARPPADPSAPRPFLDVIKGAKEQPGLFAIWRRDDKLWLEIPKEAFNKPFLFSINMASSVGERGLYASQSLGAELVEWRRQGNQVQLMALNSLFRGAGDTQRLVEQSFSPSVLAAGPVASGDHPDRKSVLVDAGMFMTDLPGTSTWLEQAFRLNYAPDRSNSFFEAARAEARLTTLTARMHYYTPRIPAHPTAPNAPVPNPPRTTPDPRSMFFSFVYNFRALPESVAPVRTLDPRIGHFSTAYVDLSDDLKTNPRVHMINRWRLEKKDAAAELSEPVQPIVYWLDRNIPQKYRQAVTDGVLEWNKAFERIGFKNAIEVKQQPDDADWDSLDAVHNSIRWFTTYDAAFAMGPSNSDPRSGEILDAHISLSDHIARGSRRFLRDDVLAFSTEAPNSSPPVSWRGDPQDLALRQCRYALDQTAELDFALELLAVRDGLELDGPEAEALAQAVIKDIITHEVGHTLGLRHNFKGSSSVSAKQLQDKAYTEAKGISNSVMDYNGYNLPLKGEPRASLVNGTLGAYDYWAIEYAYKTLPAEDEAAELAKIAARSTEPQLAFADDIDQGVGGFYDGFDPLANHRDLGDDPLAYARKRLKLSQELWDRLQSRKPQPGEDPLRVRRSVFEAFRQVALSAHNVSKYVGGMHAERVMPGVTPRAPFRPVDAAQQREALRFIASGLLSSDSFRFKPEFLLNQGLDYREWGRGLPLSIPAVVAAVQGQVLDRLLSAPTARRLIELPSYMPENQRKGMVSLAEVWGSLQGAIWSELKTGGEIDPMRRSLQREHLRRIQGLMTHSLYGAAGYADAFAVARYQANQLVAELRVAAAKPGLSVETRAHLAESLDLLTSVLKATAVRT